MLPPQLREPQEPGLVPPWIWRDGVQFFSLPELARRRQISRWAASKWARSPSRRPGQVREHNGHVYAAWP